VRAGRLLAVVVLAFAAAMPFGGAATAQTTAAPSSGAVSLVSQNAWVPRGGALTLNLRVDAAAAADPETDVMLEIHDRATTRSSFDRAIDGEGLGDTLTTLRYPVATTPRDAFGNLSVRFGLSGSDVTPRAPIRQSGSYPVSVRLSSAPDTEPAFVTWLVVVDTQANPPIDQKLNVAWLLQVVAPPFERPGGQPDERIANELQRGGRLDRLATLLARVGAMPYSLVLGPETVESWTELAQHSTDVDAQLGQVVTAARRPTTQLLPTSYVPVDVPVLEAEGLGGYLPEQFLAGAAAVVRDVGERPDTDAVFVAPANPAAVDRVRRMLVAHVVVREGDLVPAPHQFTPAQTFQLTTPQGESQAAATAPFVERLLDGTDPPALKAQRVLAALSEIAYETPAISRGVVLAPPADWNPDVAAMSVIANALRDHPLLQAVTLDDYFAKVRVDERDGEPFERQLKEQAPARHPMNRATYDAAVADFTSYRAIVGTNDPTVVEGQKALRVALSTEISSARAHAELEKVDAMVTALTNGITTSASRITLTARRAELPLSFLNSTRQGRVRVKVRLESPKLTFPEGESQSLTLPPGNTTVRFPVETRASGTFPITITVTSEDGQLQFGPPTRVTVRSAVFGRYAVALTVGALAFLAFWWGNHFWRTRRSRRVPPAPAT
jgi:hypothetical protein